MADEKVGGAGVGAPFSVEERPDRCPDFVVGEGARERYFCSAAPIHLLDHGVKATLTVRGHVSGSSGATVGTSIQPTILDAPGPQSVVPGIVTLTLACIDLPGTDEEDLERGAAPAWATVTMTWTWCRRREASCPTPTRRCASAIKAFHGDHDPGARLVPALVYGFSDCHVVREAYGSVAYDFIPSATPTP